MLGGRDVGAPGVAVDGVHPGQIYDAAPPALHHARQEGARKPERGVQVDRHDALPFVVRHLQESGRRADGGVVDQDVDGAEALQGPRRQPVHVRADADVAEHGHGLDAMGEGLPGDGVAGRLVARAVDHHVEAVPGQGEDDGAADIAPRPGDQCRSAPVRHVILLFSWVAGAVINRAWRGNRPHRHP